MNKGIIIIVYLLIIIGNVEYQTNTKNAVVYEIYDGEKLIFITPSSNFKIPDDCKKPVIYAVSATGKSVKLN